MVWKDSLWPLFTRCLAARGVQRRGVQSFDTGQTPCRLPECATLVFLLNPHQQSSVP